jgi:phosphoenolpyruvate---glycerone phosphotransferase subunit DhaK
MKKFLNAPEQFVDEMLEGIYAAHPTRLTFAAGDLRCLMTKRPVKGKVALATGGGSGHLPLFLGYVGDGMLDGTAVGGVFQSPSADQMFELTKAIDQGAGVLYIYGNYTGDIMNFDMAAEMAEMENIRVLSVVGNDDAASSIVGEEHKRRGVAGTFFVFKAAGAAAAEGMSLDDVKRVADKARLRVRTMGVALTPCIVPEVGRATFSIGENEMEIGMGIHGEPGIRRGPLRPADAVVDEMMAPMLSELALGRGDEVAVLVNGLGATPAEELYILYRRVAQLLKERDITVFHAYVGEFATAMEMAGASISLLHLDDELKRMVARAASTPFFEQAQL